MPAEEGKEELMFEKILDDLSDALGSLDGSDLCSLAKEVEASNPSLESVLYEMHDALDGDMREQAWKWVLKRLKDANDDADPDTDEDFERITKLRHLRYALAHYRFYYGDIDQIGGYPAGTPA